MGTFQPLGVGRIVHFFTTDKAKQIEGFGEGPYPALVLRAADQMTEMQQGDVRVTTAKGDFTALGVCCEEYARGHSYTEWWAWPPRT